jgi:hypothetical protein
MKRLGLASVLVLAACGGGGGPGNGSAVGDTGGTLDPASVQNRSANWSGYIHDSAAGSATQVAASWIVPEVHCGTSENSASASWTGIGGQTMLDPLLIQAGTDSDCNGGPSYYAWWEGFPAPSTPISTTQYPVRPGDTIHVALDGSSRVLWSVRIDDPSAGWSFSTTIPFGNAGLSGEWIVEAPSTTSGQLPLANFGRVNFGEATLNGASPQLVDGDAIVMVDGNNAVVAAPSAPSASGDAFAVCFGPNACP